MAHEIVTDEAGAVFLNHCFTMFFRPISWTLTIF